MNLISGISSILAIGILTPVQSILCLIILFISTSISLYTKGYELIGILYILIYVGAIAILFLFIISLLKIDYKIEKRISPIILTTIGICLLPIDITYETYGINMESYEVYNELTIVGSQLYTEYGILIIITSLILILSVIGSISIIL